VNPDKLRQHLISIFGQEYEVRYGQFRINCFYLNCSDKTGNLEISLEKGIFHCWKCHASGNITKLFRDYGIKTPPEDEFISVAELSRNFQTDFNRALIQEPQFKGLPEEFCPLWENRKLSAIGQKALKYALTRMSRDDITKHKVGYCGLGKYRWRIVIPFFEDGKTVYFVARSIYENIRPYMNPDKPDEHIIGADDVVFNLDRALELGQAVICEGVFDAIKVGEDGVAILGTEIGDVQVRKLKEIPRLYVFLDEDAKDKALKIAEKFSTYGNRVFVPFLPKGDPADWKKEQLRQIIEKGVEYSKNTELKTKLMWSSSRNH
jgi:DNA primase